MTYIVSGFHMRWNAAVGRHHPSLWHFLRKLKDQQKKTELQIAAVIRGDPRPAKRRKWRNLEKRITRLKEEYNRGARTLDQYWDAVVYCITNFV